MADDIVIGIRLTADGSDLVGEVRVGRREINQLGEAAKGAGADAERGARGVDRFGRESRETARHARRLNRESQRLGRSFAAAERRATLLKAAVFALATGMAARVVGSFIGAAAETERYGTTLKVVLGDVAEANRLFEDMAEFAGRVPFEYREIMGSATQLAGVVRGGVDEINQIVPIIADIAAATGLSIEEATSQMIRVYSAGIASADLFRERGISAALGFQAGVSVSVEESVRRIVESWEDGTSKFKGATDELADDWDGIVSMMQDKWFQFRNWVMDAGPFDFLKASFMLIDEAFETNTDGVRQTAEELGQDIVDMAKRIALGTADVFDAVAPALDVATDTIGELWEQFRAMPSEVQTIGILGTILFGRTGLAVATGILAYKSLTDAVEQMAKDLGDDIRETLDIGDDPLGIAEAFGKDGKAAKDSSGPLPAFGGRGGGVRPTARDRVAAAIGAIEGRIGALQAERELETLITGLNAFSGGGGGRSAATAPASKAHTDAVKAIEREFAKLPKTYAQAAAAAKKWRQEALAGLDATQTGYAEFASEVDAVYRHMLKEAYDEDLENRLDWQAGIERGLRKTLESYRDFADQFENLTAGTLDRAEDAWVQWSTTGKASVADLAAFVQAELARMGFRRTIAPVLENGLDFLLSAFSPGGAGGGGGGGTTAMRMASLGGVFNEPTIISEFGQPEAAVPLPDGRSIPVDLRGAIGSPGTIIQVFDQRGSGAPPIETSRSAGPDGSELVQLMVRREVREMAADGELDGLFSSRFGLAQQPIRK